MKGTRRGDETKATTRAPMPMAVGYREPDMGAEDRFADGPMREGAVGSAMSFLNHQIEELQGMVRSLEDRLSPILRMASPQPAHQNGEAKINRECPLSDAIRMKGAEVSEMNQIVSGILERLEV